MEKYAKFLKLLPAVLLAVMMSLCLTACGDGDDDADEPGTSQSSVEKGLIGSWLCESNGSIYTLKADHTAIDDWDKYNEPISGTWSYETSTGYLKFVWVAVTAYDEPATDLWKVLEINSNALTVRKWHPVWREWEEPKVLQRVPEGTR